MIQCPLLEFTLILAPSIQFVSTVIKQKLLFCIFGYLYDVFLSLNLH
uniref:Uncharacterized protein n=1 Tax=Arundo donax TaxID=35708 RepID=A0A0A9FHV0_ARUDO